MNEFMDLVLILFHNIFWYNMIKIPKGGYLMKKSLSIFILCLFLYGCAGASDYDIDLPGDYSIVRLSSQEIILAPKIEEGSWGERVVPTKIVEVGWNSDFIICKQENLNNQELYYWIININDKKVTGPINYEKFQEEINAKKINNIKLQKIEDLRK